MSTRGRRPTSAEIFNAGVRMNLARDTDDERPAAEAFLVLADRAGIPSLPFLAAAVRIVRWRLRRWWTSGGPR